MTENFVLLYNILGYEKSASKRAIVRCIDPVEPDAVGPASCWVLRDEKEQEIKQGPLVYFGDSFGLRCWTLDFTDVTQEGTYTLHVSIFDAEGNPVDEDHSEPFLIGTHIYSKHILTPITVENAKARRSPPERGYGYFDCNSAMGEARSHGVFLNGLANTWALGRDKFTPEKYEELHQAANVAFDYLVSLHNDETGEFLPAHPTRPNFSGNLWAFNSYEALWGFAAYLHLFKDVEPARCSMENYRRAQQSVAYVLENMTDEMAATFGYPRKEFMAAVYYHLYKYSGDDKWKELGIALADETLTTLNLRETCRESRHAMPMLEGVYLFMKEFPDLPRRDAWLKELKRIKAAYYEVLPAKNAFGIQPISDISRTVEEWDDNAPIPGDSRQFITRRAANVMDACYLGEMTGDESMAVIATAELNYAMGMNPGFVTRFVEAPDTTRKMAAAALLANFDRRHSEVWFWWEFPRLNQTWMSFMNGFLIKDGQYVYETKQMDSWWYSETFIKHDGTYARAICAYENYLDLISP